MDGTVLTRSTGTNKDPTDHDLSALARPSGRTAAATSSRPCNDRRFAETVDGAPGAAGLAPPAGGGARRGRVAGRGRVLGEERPRDSAGVRRRRESDGRDDQRTTPDDRTAGWGFPADVPGPPAAEVGRLADTAGCLASETTDRQGCAGAQAGAGARASARAKIDIIIIIIRRRRRRRRTIIMTIIKVTIILSVWDEHIINFCNCP